MAVALLTDFGNTDIYTGVMKAVMLGINPDLRFIDITHGIEPQNVRQAAFALMNACRYFPKGTVFLVVVDPGVGSTRRPIAVQAGGYSFVAPDNGVLSYTLAQLSNVQAVEIPDNGDEISTTFHGRDVFAPIAAKLASGVPLHDLGTPLPHLFRIPMPDLMIDAPLVLGEITHIDRFGNLVTSIGHLRWAAPDRITLHPAFGDTQMTVPVFPGNATVTINDQSLLGIRHTYSEAERGSLLALIGSSNYLEVSVNQGSAAQRLDAVIGDRVELKVGEPDATILD